MTVEEGTAGAGNLRKLAVLWADRSVARGLLCEWACSVKCEPGDYFALLFQHVLPRVNDKPSFFRDVLDLAFLLRRQHSELLVGLAQASCHIAEQSDVAILAEEACRFNQEFWHIDKEWILTVLPNDTPLAQELQRRAGTAAMGLGQGLEEDIQVSRVSLPEGNVPDGMGVPADDKLGLRFTGSVFRYTPMLRYYARDPKLRAERPFAGKRVLIILHFLRDLVPFVEAATILGLEPSRTMFFYKEYPYPQRRALAEWLRDKGFGVLPCRGVEQYLSQLSRRRPEEIGQILVIEDGGYIVPALHRLFPSLLPFTCGAVEQTTRGICNLEEWVREEPSHRPAITVLSVAGSRLKADFEPPYIAEAVVRNLLRMLPNVRLRSKHVGLLGFGTIGCKLAEQLVKANAIVTVYDPLSERVLQAQEMGLNTADSPREAASGKQFVFGATTSQSIDSDVISGLSHGTYVVSASSEQYEVDVEHLLRLGRAQRLLTESEQVIGTDFFLPPEDQCIHLLANGYPVNFWGMDSMPEEASDLILVLILLASAEVARGTYKAAGIDANAVNELGVLPEN